MSWQQVVALFVEKDVVWFLGPTLLVLAAVILIWVWRHKRNGNGQAQTLTASLQLESRISMLEKDVAVIRDGLKRVNHWMDQSEITNERRSIEQGEIRGQLKELLRRLDHNPTDPRH